MLHGVKMQVVSDMDADELMEWLILRINGKEPFVGITCIDVETGRKERLVVPDLDGFRQGEHVYLAATGGGNEWEATFPIHDALLADAEAAYGEELPDDFSMEDWIDCLFVEPINEGGYEPVAVFDLATWSWQLRE